MIKFNSVFNIIEIHINKQIRDFQNGLIFMINQCQLPLEVKRLALESVLDKVRIEADKIVAEEMRQEVEDGTVSEN